MTPDARRSSLSSVRARLEGEGACVAGVLSGTSADGIDVALTRLSARDDVIQAPELLSFSTEPFPLDVRARVRDVLDGKPCGLREAALLHRDLGRAFGRALRECAQRTRFELDLAGSHGQTVWHHDGREASGPATLQLGDGDFVAHAAGCSVVCDFRQRDIAAGGEGAPISALVDGLLFANAARPCAILNLGGMGNLTLLGQDADDVLAFDTGPANSLLDGLARRLLDAPCDRDGACALSGRVDPQLVAELAAHPFVAEPPPKSTGRDTFGQGWVESVVRNARARGILARGPADLFATATEFVAETVARGLKHAARARVRELFVAGGGVHNRALVAALERRCGVRVAPSSAAGVDPDAREALAFAVLAAACVLEIPLTHPLATGAARGSCLGKISLGRRLPA